MWQLVRAFFHTTFYEPVYNGLLYIVSILPTHDLGLSIIVFTLLLRLLLFPLARRASHSQRKLQAIRPLLKEINEQYKNDTRARALKTMELYRAHNISLGSTFLTLLVQLPILISLYYIVAFGGLPELSVADLYAFVPAPPEVSMVFVGLFDLTQKSILLAVLAGLTQLILGFVMPPPVAPEPESDGKPSFQADFGKAMQFQMRYLFPLLIVFVAHQFTAAVALYLVTSNIFSIAQELLIRRQFKAPAPLPANK